MHHGIGLFPAYEMQEMTLSAFSLIAQETEHLKAAAHAREEWLPQPVELHTGRAYQFLIIPYVCMFGGPYNPHLFRELFVCRRHALYPHILGYVNSLAPFIDTNCNALFNPSSLNQPYQPF